MDSCFHVLKHVVLGNKILYTSRLVSFHIQTDLVKPIPRMGRMPRTWRQLSESLQ